MGGGGESSAGGPGVELLVATANEGKAREFAALLAPLGLRPVAASALGLPSPEEDRPDFAGNARLKAEAAARAAGRPALGDDSGLEVEALGGDPGVLSARWGGPGRDFAAAAERVRRALLEAGVEPNGARARFVCALALAAPGAPTIEAEGEARGRLCFPPRGALGFGYDPVFVPDGHALAFAEMEPARKEALSHRARALERLAPLLPASLLPGRAP